VKGVGRLRGISRTWFVLSTIFLSSSLKGLTGLEGPPIELSSDAIVLSGSSCRQIWVSLFEGEGRVCQIGWLLL
jgi:hypothetical protein